MIQYKCGCFSYAGVAGGNCIKCINKKRDALRPKPKKKSSKNVYENPLIKEYIIEHNGKFKRAGSVEKWDSFYLATAYSMKGAKAAIKKIGYGVCMKKLDSHIKTIMAHNAEQIKKGEIND